MKFTFVVHQGAAFEAGSLGKVNADDLRLLHYVRRTQENGPPGERACLVKKKKAHLGRWTCFGCVRIVVGFRRTGFRWTGQQWGISRSLRRLILCSRFFQGGPDFSALRPTAALEEKRGESKLRWNVCKDLEGPSREGRFPLAEERHDTYSGGRLFRIRSNSSGEARHDAAHRIGAKS